MATSFSELLSNLCLLHVDDVATDATLPVCAGARKEAIRDAGGKLKFNTGWSVFLKELGNIFKLYGDGEEHHAAAFRELPLAVNYLIRHSKRGDDHLWLLKYDSPNQEVIDFANDA